MLILVLAGIVCSPGSASASSPLVRLATPPPALPAGAQLAGVPDPGTPLQASVILRPADPAGLARVAQEVTTPGSPLFHRYLSVSQFTARFAPAPTQLDAVRAALAGEGLTIGSLSPNHLSLTVHGTAAALERAFAVPLRRYRLPGGRTGLHSSSAPAVPPAVAPLIRAVVGLDTLHRHRPAELRKLPRASRLAPQPHVSGGSPHACQSAASTAYTPAQIAAAYHLSNLYASGNLGAGSTVALYELEPYDPADIAAYQSCYGTSTSVTNVEVGSGPGSGAGQGEAALDIEDVIGLAPQANLLVYQGANAGSGPYDTLNQIVADNHAKVVSISWGACEADLGSGEGSAEAALLQEAAVQGQSVLAASGDGGAQDCTDQLGNQVNQLAVDDPASQPYATGVGGTSLSAPGPPPSETVWNSGTGSGGGGISALWRMPAYQSGAPASVHVAGPNSSGTPCAATPGLCRQVPDVSADANPATGYAIRYSGTWYSFGGTSAAAPTWAALLGLVDASAACTGSPVGFVNPALYSAAGTDSNLFNDVTSGNNSLGSSGGFAAGAGYDMASGLGTPVGDALVSSLCAHPSLSDPGSQASLQGSHVSLQLHASGGAPGGLSFSAAGLPPGLSLDTASGTISGAPTMAGSWSVKVTVSDSVGASSSASFLWTVFAPAPPTVAPPPLLTPPPSVPTTSTTTSSTASSRIVLVAPPTTLSRVGARVWLRVRASAGDGSAMRFSAQSLPAGLWINSSSGLITGRPTVPGRRLVRVIAAGRGGSMGSAQFTWTVAGLPSASTASLRVPGRRNGARLSITVSAGRYAPALVTVAVHVDGISFSRDLSRLQGGVVVTSAGQRLRARLSLRGTTLTVTLKRPAGSVTVVVPARSATISRRLLTRRGTRSVHVTGAALDASGFASPLR